MVYLSNKYFYPIAGLLVYVSTHFIILELQDLRVFQVYAQRNQIWAFPIIVMIAQRYTINAALQIFVYVLKFV